MHWLPGVDWKNEPQLGLEVLEKQHLHVAHAVPGIRMFAQFARARPAASRAQLLPLGLGREVSAREGRTGLGIQQAPNVSWKSEPETIQHSVYVSPCLSLDRFDKES